MREANEHNSYWKSSINSEGTRMSTKNDSPATPTTQIPPRDAGTVKQWFIEHRTMLLKLHQEGKLPFSQIEELLIGLEKAVTNPPMIDEVDVMKHYTRDPLCKRCGGTGRLAINRVPDRNLFSGSFYQVLLCPCATPAKSDYLKMEELIVSLSRAHHDAIVELRQSMDRLGMNLDEQVSIQRDNINLLDKVLFRIDRHTAGYWIAKIMKPFADRWESWEQRRIQAKEAASVRT